MARLFDEHIKRSVKSLDGAWRFRQDKNDVGEKEEWYKKGINGYTVTVPSVWNTELGLLDYEGVSWYEKSFFFEGGTLRLNFGAVMTYAKVYLDGEYLGDHYGGFCRFDFIKAEVLSGMHTVSLRVDNRFDDKSIPQKQVDWYHYGGITRSVEAERLLGISVLSNRMDYELSKSGASCRFTVELYNASEKTANDTVCVSLDGERVADAIVSLAPYEKTVCVLNAEIKSVRLWSQETPNLYELLTQSSTDDLYDRVGFRHVEVKNTKIYINGKETRLLGINRHEEHPDFGMAFPVELMKRDIDIIVGAECNSIRGSHYPNNPTFIDMLDERGITFWSEIPIWGGGFSEDALKDEDVVLRGLKMHAEMVKEYCNHPSIIIWGMHNEIKSSLQAAYEMSKRYYNFLKENGGNRLVTYATCYPLNDICLEFCDIICINMYCGWYNTEIEYWPTFLDEFEARRRELGYTDKPVIMSEFGAAAIYGHHTFDDLKWTEEYQARLFSYTLDLFHSRKEYVGTYVWQFSDIRTAQEMGLNRARSFNNKGLVNEYRRPKLAYAAVREAHTKIKEKCK